MTDVATDPRVIDAHVKNKLREINGWWYRFCEKIIMIRKALGGRTFMLCCFASLSLNFACVAHYAITFFSNWSESTLPLILNVAGQVVIAILWMTRDRLKEISGPGGWSARFRNSADETDENENDKNETHTQRRSIHPQRPGRPRLDTGMLEEDSEPSEAFLERTQ